MNGFCYTAIEALSVGTHVLLTKCPVFDELGIKNKIHGFLLDFDMKNIPINEIYKGLPRFKYKVPEDNWDKYLTKEKSNYKEEFSKVIKLEVIKDFSLGRFDEMKNKGENPDIESIKANIIARDEQDMNRKIAPLKKAEDAVHIDSSYMSIDQVVERIVTLAGEAAKKAEEN